MLSVMEAMCCLRFSECAQESLSEKRDRILFLWFSEASGHSPAFTTEHFYFLSFGIFLWSVPVYKCHRYPRWICFEVFADVHFPSWLSSKVQYNNKSYSGYMWYTCYWFWVETECTAHNKLPLSVVLVACYVYLRALYALASSFFLSLFTITSICTFTKAWMNPFLFVLFMFCSAQSTHLFCAKCCR